MTNPVETRVPDEALSSILKRSMLPARIVLIVLCVYTLCALVLFAYQYRMDVVPGIRYVSTTEGAIHVWAHLLRAVCVILLAIAVTRYLRAINATQSDDHQSLKSLCRSLLFLWKTAAAIVAIALGYGLLTVFLLNRGRETYYEQVTPVAAPEVLFELRLADTSLEEAAMETEVPQTGERIWLHPYPILANRHVASAVASQSGEAPNDSAVIEIVLTEDGGAAMEWATTHNQGRRLVILLDGKIMSAPIINSPVGRRAVISGIDSMEEARRIASAIASMPAKN